MRSSSTGEPCNLKTSSIVRPMLVREPTPAFAGQPPSQATEPAQATLAAISPNGPRRMAYGAG
eukprot:11477758-Prorocentrum_lima.AAC.1